MGRTNIVLDDSLVSSCQKATGIKTRKKLRIRTYARSREESEILFLEIKRRKNNIIIKDLNIMR